MGKKKNGEKFDPVRRRLVKDISLAGVGIVVGGLVVHNLELVLDRYRGFTALNDQPTAQDYKPSIDDEKLEDEVAQLVKSNAHEDNTFLIEESGRRFYQYSVNLSNLPLKSSNNNLVGIVVMEFIGIEPIKPVIVEVQYLTQNGNPADNDFKTFRRESLHTNTTYIDLKKSFFEHSLNEFEQKSTGKVPVMRLNQDQRDNAREFLFDILRSSWSYYQNRSRNYTQTTK